MSKKANTFPGSLLITGWDLQPCYCEMAITVVEFYGPYYDRSFQIERGDPSHELDGLR